MYISGHAINRILNQLTFGSWSRWFFVIFLSQKLFLTKTRHKTYDGKL